jgi:DNA-binding SARP family transcriptional activator
MQVLLLGPLEVVDDDGTVVALSGTKIRALTALLALEAGRVVSTDRLIERLYGNELPQGAANALQLHVSRLRRALRSSGCAGEHAIVTRPPGYLLDIPSDAVDVLRFNRLAANGRACMEAGLPADASRILHEALALWRGEALVDFAYDDTAAVERERLAELWLSVTEDCMAADLELGHHVECVERLERLVRTHPLRERLWEHLMVALYGTGRQAEALQAFQDVRRHLGDELGIDPGPELRRLESAILAQDPSLAMSPRRAPFVRAAPVWALARSHVAEPLIRCTRSRRRRASARVARPAHWARICGSGVGAC